VNYATKTNKGLINWDIIRCCGDRWRLQGCHSDRWWCGVR